jgi:hypothetical protein
MVAASGNEPTWGGPDIPASSGGGGGGGGGGSGGASSSSLGKLGHSGTTVSITISCSAGTGSCDDTVGLAAQETLRGSKIVAVAARRKTKRRVVLFGSKTVTVAAGTSQKVGISLDGAGRSLLKRFDRLPLLLVVLQGKTTVGSEKLTLVLSKR